MASLHPRNLFIGDDFYEHCLGETVRMVVVTQPRAVRDKFGDNERWVWVARNTDTNHHVDYAWSEYPEFPRLYHEPAYINSRGT